MDRFEFKKYDKQLTFLEDWIGRTVEDYAFAWSNESPHLDENLMVIKFTDGYISCIGYTNDEAGFDVLDMPLPLDTQVAVELGFVTKEQREQYKKDYEEYNRNLREGMQSVILKSKKAVVLEYLEKYGIPEEYKKEK